MSAPGEIPIVSGRGARPEPSSADLVWVVDGEDKPFRDASETQRPWLEDSFDWAEGGSGSSAAASSDSDSGDLVWL